MSSDPNNQGQYPPPQWENHPPRGAYPIAQQALNYRQPPPPPSSQPYPNPPGSTTGDMVTLPPPGHQQQDFYRHPPPYDMYPGHPPDMRAPPPQHMYQNQPAPRQRTAIACRYCRRRKIRCSGFEASEDGRCTNCQRFQQECIFTPVSSQAQAFVPAHTAYPHLRNAGPMQPQRGGRALYPQPGQTPIYGAHGQPLGTLPPQGVDPYQQPPPQGYPMQQPPGPYQQGQVYDDRGAPQPPPTNNKVSRKRPRTDEPHPAVPPPPPPPHTPSSQANQARPSASGGRRGSGGTGGYEYPDPTGLVPVSPASSATSYASAPYPQQQPYYAPQPPPPARRSSPQSSYSYEARASGSPHGSTSSSSAPAYNYTGGLHPPQVLPDRTGRTPPPQQREASNNGSAQRGGMAVRDLLGPGNESQGGRSNTDSDMLKQLNKRGM